MRLEDYFVFLAPDDIRIKGTHIGIESILYDYLYLNEPPEAIGSHHPAILLEHVYATITYYYHHREAMDAYLARTLEREKQRREQLETPNLFSFFRKEKIRREPARLSLALNWAR